MPQAHTIPVDGNGTVAAVHHEREDGRGHAGDGDCWIVFCHGLISDKTGSYEWRCKRAVAEGYDAVRFDFRGCGESDGAFVDSALSARVRDLRAVVEYFDPTSYVLFGSSFGCKTALHAATGDDRVEAVVGRAPVTYTRAFAAYRDAVEDAGELRLDDEHAIDRRFLDDLERYPFESVVEELAVPVAIFHGADDDSVPFSDSLEATAALDVDVLLQKYVGEGHRFSRDAEERLLEQTFDWLTAVGVRDDGS